MKGVPAADARECKVYERLAGSGAAGGFIRPGGVVLTERALDLCGFPPGSRLLDVGCGVGGSVEHLCARHGYRAVGVDPSHLMITQGRARNETMHLVPAQGEHLPFPDAQFEGALAECSLSLAPLPEVVLRECLRVLKPGGKLILSDVYVRNAEVVPELRSLGLHSCITGAPCREEVLQRLDECGFSILSWEDHSHALKVFAAGLILSQDSTCSFWCSLTGALPEDGRRIEQAVSRARPGYFLIIAMKPKSSRYQGFLCASASLREDIFLRSTTEANL